MGMPVVWEEMEYSGVNAGRDEMEKNPSYWTPIGTYSFIQSEKMPGSDRYEQFERLSSVSMSAHHQQ